MSELRGQACNFANATFTDCTVGDADLSRSCLKSSTLTEVSLAGSNLCDCDFSNSTLTDVVFFEARISKRSDFRGATMVRTSFDGVRDENGKSIPDSIGYRHAKHGDTSIKESAP